MQIFTIILFLYNIPLLFINQWKKKNKLELIVRRISTQQTIEYYLQINFSIVSNRMSTYYSSVLHGLHFEEKYEEK